MPVQKSSVDRPITPAAFENSFESNFVRFGLKGLNINDAIDAVEPNELTRMLNVTHRLDMSITGREGQTNLTGSATGVNHHTIKRLNSGSSYTRLYGVDTSLYMGTSSLSLVSTGFSGHPLSMVQYHPPLSGASWMYVGDSDKMLKVRDDGLALPIGLPAPSTAATTALATENRLVLASMTSSDGTDAAAWTGNKGFIYDPQQTPIEGTELLDITDDDGEPAVHFGAIQSTPTLSGYFAYYGVPKTLNMNALGGETATDDDYIHLKLNFSHTQFIKEFRIYFVVSESFSPSILPGQDGGGGANSDAYVKAFSANDFAGYIQAQLTQFDSSELSRIHELRNDNLTQSTPPYRSGRLAFLGPHPAVGVTLAQANVSPNVTIAPPANAASDTWQPYSIVGIPLRRGEFQRIGMNQARTWANVTGIITYIQTGPSGDYQVETVAARLSQLYMTGGSGPDSGEPEDSPYDYRYTNYDPRTGAQGNPSPVQSDANFLDALRRSITVTPTAYGDSNIRQRIYRRGGTLPTDWFYVGENSADGAAFTDAETDGEAGSSTPLATDNYQPVATVDSSGTTVLAQPLSYIWGPLQDLIFGVGDPYRPGDVYFCKPGTPDSWPDDYRTEVTAPSEPLLCGVMYNSQSFVFSSERGFILYPNFSGQIPSVSAANTGCTRGPVAPWAIAVGLGGIYFVNNDGVYSTVGGAEEWLSIKIDPIFRGVTANGYLPIDFTNLDGIRLEIFENELYFQYVDTDGDTQVMIYSIPFKFWRAYQFDAVSSCFYSDEGNDESVMLIGGLETGKSYTYSGTSDDGAEISCSLRTAALDFGRPRLEKRFGDQTLDFSSEVDLTLTNYVDFEAVQNTDVSIAASTGRQVAILDDFGTTPERAKNIASNIAWSTDGTQPLIYQLGTTLIVEPDVTVNRVTQWDDLGHPDASYLMGVTFDVDTAGVDRTILIEGDYDGATFTVATLTVNAAGRHKVKFSWPGQLINKCRVRPNDDCLVWQLFKVDWIAQVEPPNIAVWDSYFENGWDQYYTGLDLYCNTFGQDKTVEVYADGVLVKTETVNTNGRLVHHITLPWGRAHVFHFIATDANPGMLYDFRWHLDPEPSEQTNWNQNFTTQSALYDKYLKAVVFECDTFNEVKDVTVECDGVVVETLQIQADGRKVVQKAFPQHLGRVFRVYPVDDNPGRLYSLQFVFDGEPFALDRWETQEGTNGINGWSYATYAHVTLKSTTDVTFDITAYNQSGVATTKTYTIPSTAGVKVKTFVPFQAMKGVLHKYVLTSEAAFTLYQEETTVYVREWGTDATATIHPFGDSDQDATRNMFNAALAAARPGGTA